MKPSAGSLRGRFNEDIASASSKVSGASRIFNRVRLSRIQLTASGISFKPLSWSRRSSQTLTADSQISFSGLISCRATRAERRPGSKTLQTQIVRVEKQLQSRPASQSSRLPLGPTMSPRISPVPTMQPSQHFGRFSGEGGTTSATGLPKRVTRIGLRVLRTSSRMPRHFALNTEMVGSFISCLYHGQYFLRAPRGLPVGEKSPACVRDLGGDVNPPRLRSLRTIPSPRRHSCPSRPFLLASA
jgi:hypothetical protein